VATALAKAPAAPAAVATIAPIQPVRPPRPRPAAARPELPPEPARPAPRAAESLPAIAISAPAPAVDPALERGYEALQKNDLAAAREAYQRALAREPTSRDALLGLAAIEVRSGQLDSAESRYAKLLETDPRDATALASLLSLRGQLDPVTAESRLKNLLATHPDAAPLHFSLGNQYAQQSRWSEAQGAYFKAYSVDPENADYAFNLAVSLDRLHQKNLALDYYQRALALAAKRSAGFNPAQARTRVQELSR
jgi:tetratricopeptide (TPR) repeat protein